MATPLPGVWGIDLGQCGLKALRLQVVDGAVKATAYDYIEHAKILSQPDADPDQLVREALTQFLSRNNLRGDMVVIGVPGQSGLARFVKLPPVEEKKIADIVRFEAKQQIPFPLEEVVWDFQKVSEGTVTDGFALETEIGLFAMKRDMVNRALQHFKDVNVEVHVIQMAPLALVNYVAYDLLEKKEGQPEPGAKKDCIVALDIGTDNSNLVITDGAKIIWQRPIPLGGNHFTRALTKDLKLTFAKAEHLKRNAVKSPELKKILAALKPVLNDFVGEVQRSLGYFTNTHRDANILYMIGLGNAFRLPGIQKYLQEKLQLEVRKLQTFDRVQGDEVLGAPQFSENIMSFGVPYGLSLQGLKQTKLQTNLLPYEVRVERIVRGKKPWAVAAAAALLLMVFGLTWGQSMAKSAVDNKAIEKAMATAAAAVKSKQSFDSQDADLLKKISDSGVAIDRIGAGVKERLQWQLLMEYINKALPQPNGEKLTKKSQAFSNLNLHAKYFTDKAILALNKHEERRFASTTKKDGPVDPSDAVKADELIKRHLVQVSIEGVNNLYTEDLPSFFKRLVKDSQTLRGMYRHEQKMIIDEDKSLPTKGYVIEIRGYTYHEKGIDFVIETLLENLKNPEQEGVNPGISKEKDRATGKDKDSEMKIKIMDNLGFFVVYKDAKVINPELNVFPLIKTSYLRELVSGDATGGGGSGGKGVPSAAQGFSPMSGSGGLKGGGEEDGGKSGPKGPDRSSWKPLGDVAAAALGGGGGGSGGGFGGIPSAAGSSSFTFSSGRPASGGQVGDTAKPGVGPMNTGATTKEAPVTVSRQDRYEFVVLCIWKEPAPAAADEQKK